MTIEYNNVMTDDNLSVEISTNELSELVSSIGKFGLEGFIKGLTNSSKDEEKTKEDIHEKIMNSPKVKAEDLMNPPEKSDDIIKCRSFSHSGDANYQLIQRWLTERNIPYQKGTGVTAPYIDYELNIGQLKDLYEYLTFKDDKPHILI